VSRNDVAIYAPHAQALYERRPRAVGGAERQTMLLARGLAERGYRVGHIVLEVTDPAPLPERPISLVERAPMRTHSGITAQALEGERVWRALSRADADTYVFRSGWAVLGVAAVFCRLHRRRLIFSSANDLDFTFDFFNGRPVERGVYRFGVSRADAVVVQHGGQVALARKAFPRLRRIVEIPSFAEPAPLSHARPEAFLWTGRLDHFKQPLRYLDLAERLPEARFWLIPKFLGEEQSPLSEEVRRRVAQLPNLEMLEPQPHAAAMRLLERAVAVVNTGAAEGMPNTFLEAWARGIPVLTFEFDPHGRVAARGLGVSASGSFERFVTGARQLWEGRCARAELSACVRAYIDETHGLQAVTRAWDELLRTLRRDRAV
jgi:glycosyltransferase involved in cell wall biosynthesis